MSKEQQIRHAGWALSKAWKWIDRLRAAAPDSAVHTLAQKEWEYWSQAWMQSVMGLNGTEENEALVYAKILYAGEKPSEGCFLRVEVA